MAAAAVCALTPPLLPTPPPSARAPEKKNAKPGRASSSRNWSTDKLVARVSSSLAGRASLSADWRKDKAEYSKERQSRVDRKRSPSPAPATDRSDKKAKVCYAGPEFIKSPDPNELPIPKFVKSPHPSELPMPSFLKAPKASSSD